MRVKPPIPKLGIGHGATTPSPPLWIPVRQGPIQGTLLAGMTKLGAVEWGHTPGRGIPCQIGVRDMISNQGLIPGLRRDTKG